LYSPNSQKAANGLSMSAVLRQSVYKARLTDQLSFQLSENVLWLRSDNPTNHSALYKKNMQQFTSKVVSELNVGVFAWRAAPSSETEWIAQSTFDSVQTSLTERPTSCEIFSHRSVTPPGYRATALASKVSSWSVHSLPSAACWPNTKFTMTIVQQPFIQDNPGSSSARTFNTPPLLSCRIQNLIITPTLNQAHNEGGSKQSYDPPPSTKRSTFLLNVQVLTYLEYRPSMK